MDINPAWNSDYPVAKIDSAVIRPGETIYVDVFANDYDPQGDPIYINPNVSSQWLSVLPEVVGNSVKITLSFTDYEILDIGWARVSYIISDTLPVSGYTGDMAYIYLKVENGNYFDYLDINNIKAHFSCQGVQLFNKGSGTSFSFPEDRFLNMAFPSSLWIGGKTYGSDTVLHIAAERHRYTEGDFSQGPVSNSYNLPFDQKWFHAWKLSKEEIEFHKQNWWQPGYSPIGNILTWPGNGDVSLGQMEKLAPFHDNDNDGVYEPLQGDYPYIRGDQAIFFIFNDDRHEHYETGGNKLGIEIHGMAYAFDMPQNTTLWNTVFLHYDIINRSDTTYYETYIGNYTDADLGFAQDDYMGCNVEGGYYFYYNGEPVDGNGQYNAFGSYPPSVAVQILGGPKLEADNLDNPDGQCDESVNGLGFGDSIIDNERIGMTAFYTENSCWEYPNQLNDADQLYDFMRGYCSDGNHIVYGLADSTGNNPITNFMFPGLSDPCGWGQGGVPMAEWSEMSEQSPAGDRRGIGIIGPFTFHAGQTVSVDYAYMVAFGDNPNYLSALDSLEAYTNYITMLFDNNSPIFTEIDSYATTLDQIRVFPNPGTDVLYIDAQLIDFESSYSLFDIAGKLQQKGTIHAFSNNPVYISGLESGMYFLRVSAKEGTRTFKILKL